MSQEHVTIWDKTFKKYIDQQQIAERIDQMANTLRIDYEGETPLFMCVLNGAALFAADLVRAYAAPCELCFVKLRSYEGIQSTGQIKVELPPPSDLADHNIIIVEDIIDTGSTLHHFLPILAQQNPRQVRIASLLVKPDAHLYPIRIDYSGFDIPNDFVVGYGLDYDQRGRELADIYRLVK